MVRQGNDKFTISVNRLIKRRFKDYCEKQGLKAGKQIENFMKEVIKRG